MAIATVINFVEALRDSRVLTAAQVEELARDLQARFPEPRALARELIQRGWVTPYQVNQLFQGRGKSLVLGPYLLVERLGEGGTGRAFRARHEGQNRIVVVKLVRKEHLPTPEAVQAVYRDFAAAGKLSHPNLAANHAITLVGDTHIFVMEYVEGIDLGKLLKQRGHLPIGDACSCVRQAALGMQHAHEHGLVHRDLKPNNLVSAQGAITKVLDLGLSRLQHPASAEDDSWSVRQEGALIGTPDYLAPEQARDAHTIDPRSDIYSLGCTLYHLLVGRPPFPQGTPFEKVRCHQEVEPIAVERLRPDLPSGLAELLRRMMAKRPADRFPTMAETARSLEPFAGQLTQSAITLPDAGGGSVASAGSLPGIPVSATTLTPVPTVPAATPLVHTRSRRRWILAAAVVALAGIVVGAVALLSSSSKRPQGPDQSSPPSTRLAWHPKELERVLGEDRGRHWGVVRCVAYSDDGQVVASGGDDRAVRVWDADTLLERAMLLGHKGPVTHVTVSSDGRHVLSAGEDQAVLLWDVARGALLRPFVGQTQPVTCLALSSDGRRAAIASPDRTLRLWDVETGLEERQFEQSTSARVDSLAFSADGRYLLGGGEGGRLRLWQVDTGKEARQFVGHTTAVTSVAMSADGRYVFSAGGAVETKNGKPAPVDCAVRMWDAKTARPVRYFAGHVDRVLQLAGARGGNHLLTRGADKTLRLWNVQTGDKLHRWEGDPGPFNAAALSPDGKRVLTAGADHTLRQWDTETGKEIQPPRGHTLWVAALAFARDGQRLVSGGGDKTVRVWNLATGDETRRLEGHPEPILNVALTPDGRRVLSSSPSLSRQWNAESGDSLGNRRLPEGNSRTISSAYSADGQYALFGSLDKTFRLEDLRSGQMNRQYAGPRQAVTAVTFSPDSKRALAGSADRSVRLWDLEKGTEILRVGGPTEPVRCVAVSPDGRLGSAGGDDATVRLWDLTKTGPQRSRIFRGHTAPVLSVAFAPNGHRIVSSGQDGRVIIWDLSSGVKQQEWSLPGAVHQAAFDAEGGKLALANANGTIYILRLGGAAESTSSTTAARP